jgi:hypothetical protein
MKEQKERNLVGKFKVNLSGLGGHLRHLIEDQRPGSQPP